MSQKLRNHFSKLAVGLGLATLALQVNYAQANPTQNCQLITKEQAEYPNFNQIFQQLINSCVGNGAVVLDGAVFKIEHINLPANTTLTIKGNATLMGVGQGQIGANVGNGWNSSAQNASERAVITVAGDNVVINGNGYIRGNTATCLPAAVNANAQTRSANATISGNTAINAPLTKEQQKAAEKAAKEQAKAAEKAAKEQAKAAEQAEKAQYKVSLPETLTPQNSPSLIRAVGVKNFTLTGVALGDFAGNALYLAQAQNVKLSQIAVRQLGVPQAQGLVFNGVQNLQLDTAYVAATGANLVLMAQSQPTTEVKLNKVYTYGGNGLVIGYDLTQGISKVQVNELVAQGSAVGIAIATNAQLGGKISDLSFAKVYVDNVATPLYIAANHKPAYRNAGANIPSFSNINVSDFYSLGGGQVELSGYDTQHKVSVNFKNVRISKVAEWKVYNADIKNLGNSTTGSFSSASIDEVKAVIYPQLKPFPLK
ncbi:glycosyl hydrolase family 28 protein [Psittacicella hinzii]|uniref:Uncharacterized protein n=1 Tax=Psittacicella hinzii TaxID=2028575 RepID=A0A3A1YIF8_9GAMM|nr:glycosyl hydrolase family 28 protein [Psittacicella hinzii]RIY37942.1 hypothetical protein CKF58_04430 [Psittacicella hinzii]